MSIAKNLPCFTVVGRMGRSYSKNSLKLPF